ARTETAHTDRSVPVRQAPGSIRAWHGLHASRGILRRRLLLLTWRLRGGGSRRWGLWLYALQWDPESLLDIGRVDTEPRILELDDGVSDRLPDGRDCRAVLRRIDVPLRPGGEIAVSEIPLGPVDERLIVKRRRDGFVVGLAIVLANQVLCCRAGTGRTNDLGR